MIFSFSDGPLRPIPESSLNLDIFTFFRSQGSVHCPREIWFKALCTSLKMKREVLILEESLDSLPDFRKERRWDTGANWSWLAPRALSVISAEYEKSLVSYSDLKKLLSTHK